jgi:hypothetical protein
MKQSPGWVKILWGMHFHENLHKQHPNGVLVGHLSLTKSKFPPQQKRKQKMN